MEISSAVASIPKSKVVETYTQGTNTVELPPQPQQGEISSPVSPFEIVQAGKEYYQTQKFAEAIAKWEQAAKTLSLQGDTLNEALVLSNLTQAYKQLGKLIEANKAIARSIELLSPFEAKNPHLLAGVLNVQGSLQLTEGKAEEALAVWQRAAQIYEKTGEKNGLTRCLLNQTQAFNALGMHRLAITTLQRVNQTLENQPDSLLKMASLLNLGDTLRVMGDMSGSVQALQQSLAIAQRIKSHSDSDINQIFLALGNTTRFIGQTQQALKYYQQAISTSKSPTTAIEAQLNSLALLIDTEQQSLAVKLAAQIQPQLQKLSPSRTSIYAQVNYVQSLQRLDSINILSNQEIAKILAHAVQQAESIGDYRAESYALGSLGKMYEQTQQFESAQTLTDKALILAQTSNAPDIVYRWQWQLGRILNKQNKLSEAIAAYNGAVTTLSYIRNDLVASSFDFQFSFRESVEPVYRELVSLLLTPNQGEVSQANLKKAREVIESLQLAELDNYFNEHCLKANPTEIDKIDSQAAVIYPIILRDRLEIVVSLPQQPLHHYTTTISQNDLEIMVQKMRQTIARKFLKKQHFSICQEFYNLLIKPWENDLASSRVKTLTFVLDGFLKDVPIAALHDGQQYLIEKYDIALSPGIQLLAPQTLKTQKLEILVGGLSEGRQGFSPLPSVETEVEEIKSEIPIQVLLNQKFTSLALQKQISKSHFPVVHLATHGEFSSKAEETFILTWDNRVNVKELGEILQSRGRDNANPIELLVLSACKTANGDKRAPLGLAGVAVRSGARSTVASLWSVDDKSTSELMAKFYQQLTKSGVTKAEALRHAQMELLQTPEFKHPYYWAAFVLLGNWL